MTKRKSAGAKPGSASSASVAQSVARHAETSPAAGGSHHLLPSAAAIREAVESVAIAFILAFLFRTFEAEAFVIPTGSMAPTLMGRHKDVVCPKCHCPYRVSASEEVNADGVPLGKEAEIESGTCPMCRYTYILERDPSYNGDRILVNKFAYEIAEPQRWDVIVFKYPGDSDDVPIGRRTDSRTNFIKRLVGLPGETIRIEDGEVWLVDPQNKDKGQGAAKTIARKPPKKLLAMLQPVFDNDYMPRIAEYGWPARWRPFPDSPSQDRAAGAWRSDDLAAFSIDGTAKGEQWLRYQHRVPSYRQWQQVEDRSAPTPEPQLITDFAAYDTGKTRSEVYRLGPGPAPDGLGQHWVGDLAVDCTADVEGPSGTLALELCKAGRRFQCRFDLSTGQAILSISGPDMAAWRPTASTAVHGKGQHRILFSNCDDELRLWVDGALVSFDVSTDYLSPEHVQPDSADLAPVGIASTGASLRISHLRVLRDIYYIAAKWRAGGSEEHDVWYQPGNALPDQWKEPQQMERYVQFSLKKDQFFVLGDNSAKSKDGRLWGPDYWVPRDLLIGKALFIYWPHSWDQIPFTKIPFPYFPNFSRMRLVR